MGCAALHMLGPILVDYSDIYRLYQEVRELALTESYIHMYESPRRCACRCLRHVLCCRFLFGTGCRQLPPDSEAQAPSMPSFEQRVQPLCDDACVLGGGSLARGASPHEQVDASSQGVS